MKLEQALEAAVNQMLKDTIAFKPTLVALSDVQLIGERLYFRVLVADEDDERVLSERTNHEGDAPGVDRPSKTRTTL